MRKLVVLLVAALCVLGVAGSVMADPGGSVVLMAMAKRISR